MFLYVFFFFLYFQSYGEFVGGSISDEQRKTVLHNACPGAGACGGMYTANTMASAIEAMGMSLPYRLLLTTHTFFSYIYASNGNLDLFFSSFFEALRYLLKTR